MSSTRYHHGLIAGAGSACALILATIAMTGCERTPAGLVARSDLGDVTRSELDSYILEQPENLQKPKPGESLADWRRTLTERLLVDRALEAEVEARPAPAPREIDAAVEEARKQALLAAFEAEAIDSRVRVDEEAVRAYYDAHPDEVSHPEQIRLRHIFRRVARDAPPDARQATRAEMEALLDRLRSGAHFGDLARQYSESETASLDGLIGRLSRGALDPQTEAFVWDLDEGEISEVYETPVGFHIFRLENHLAPGRQAFEEVRGRLTERLQREERERVVEEIVEAALAESGAEYHPERLSSDEPLEPGTVLFALDNDVITWSSLEAYRRGTRFLPLRNTPPEAWLENQVRARLFLWMAERNGLADRPDVARQLDAAERRVLRQRALEGHIQDRLTALDAEGELRRHYQERALRFQLPKKVHLRLVEVDFDEQGPAYGVRERLEALAREIRAGRRDMAEVARAISDGPSAPEGGDVGWILLDGVGAWAGPSAQRAVSELEVGELSEPLLIERYDARNLTYRRQGYVLVRKEGEDAPRPLSFEEAWMQVADSYREEHRDLIMADVRRDILASIDAEIFEENL